ncbi:MAG: ATP-binding protein [candidate division WOR-3 bacterium]|nr:ATP-binding protein [candidate division WOR-3 bacterium]
MKPEDLNKKYMECAYRLYQLFEMKKDMMRRYPAEIEEIFYGKTSILNKKELNKIDTAIKSVRKALLRIARHAGQMGVDIPVEKIVKKYELGSEERDILLAMFFKELEMGRFEITGRELLIFLGYEPFQFIEKSKILEGLLKKNIIECEFTHPFEGLLLKAEFALALNIFKDITGKEIIETDTEVSHLHRGFTKFIPGEYRNKKRKESKFLNVYEPVLTFENLVLEPEKLKAIERAVFQAKNLNQIFEEWGLNQTIKYGKGTVMLFYGPPGTGKTATSEAIAHRLGKKIGMVNYENVLGCWVGESEKNLVLAFEEAKREDCVLVFDEADALFAKRFYETYSTDRMHNYMTNILMKELERFDGVVILTTNREVVIDEAFDRRIILKLKFEMPSPEERAKIWRKLIPEKVPLASDVDFERLGRYYELSGGEIKNAILNAVMECAYQGERYLKMELLEEFAQKETEKLKGRNGKSVGFNVGTTLCRRVDLSG